MKLKTYKAEFPMYSDEVVAPCMWIAKLLIKVRNSQKPIKIWKQN